MVGAADFAAGKLFVLKPDGTPETNIDGTAKRHKVWCSMQVILYYLAILENAFVIDSLVGGFGGNLIAKSDMG